MRVVSGSARGTKLINPDGDSFRPTLDRVKEAVFSMLGEMYDLKVLDLFSGSGALGIEALSRGAKASCFVDKSKYSMDITKANLEKTHLTDKAECYLCDYKSFLGKNTEKFDLVFLDPPYRDGVMYDALSLLSTSALNVGSRVLCEMDDDVVSEIPPEYVLLKDKKYGRCRVFLLELGDRL